MIQLWRINHNRLYKCKLSEIYVSQLLLVRYNTIQVAGFQTTVAIGQSKSNHSNEGTGIKIKNLDGLKPLWQV